MSRAQVLLVEDDADLREALADTLQLAGYEVLQAEDGRAALALADNENLALVISDVQMPGMDGHSLLRTLKTQRAQLPVLLMTAYGTIERAVQALHEGAADYLVKPFEPEVLVHSAARYALQPVENDGMVCVDPASQALASLAQRVARADATVLITGESGVGKEVLARYIHAQSARAAGPFVALNCAAIPESMLEATLFGYEKGAFTGAYKACPGKFEQAQGGTLLLDEISEMALGLQAKLLRVLQEREVERLGGGRMVALDVRVLGTSNRDLKATVAAGEFREDLYYRLNVFPLNIPPLRARTGDIVPLAEACLARHAQRQGRTAPSLAPEAARQLNAYPWPGNARELDNVMQRALILQPGQRIEAQDLALENSTPPVPAVAAVAAAPMAAPVPAPCSVAEGLADDVQQHEWRLILEVMHGQPTRRAAAAQLGISERTLRYKLARMREAGLRLPQGAEG